MWTEDFVEKTASYKLSWIRSYRSKTPPKGYIEDSNLQLNLHELPSQEKNQNFAVFKKILERFRRKQAEAQTTLVSTK